MSSPRRLVAVPGTSKQQQHDHRCRVAVQAVLEGMQGGPGLGRHRLSRPRARPARRPSREAVAVHQRPRRAGQLPRRLAAGSQPRRPSLRRRPAAKAYRAAVPLTPVGGGAPAPPATSAGWNALPGPLWHDAQVMAPTPTLPCQCRAEARSRLFRAARKRLRDVFVACVPGLVSAWDIAAERWELPLIADVADVDRLRSPATQERLPPTAAGDAHHGVTGSRWRRTVLVGPRPWSPARFGARQSRQTTVASSCMRGGA